MRADTARGPIRSSPWNGGGFVPTNKRAAKDSQRAIFQNHFQCSENKGKSTKHDTSSGESGSEDSVFCLRGGEKMGSNYGANKVAHAEEGPIVQGIVERREVVPQLTRLQLCDEVEDQDRPLSGGGLRGGQQGNGLNMLNVEQSYAILQPLFGRVQSCMATALHGHAKQRVTMPRSVPITRGDQISATNVLNMEQASVD